MVWMWVSRMFLLPKSYHTFLSPTLMEEGLMPDILHIIVNYLLCKFRSGSRKNILSVLQVKVFSVNLLDISLRDWMWVLI